MKSFYCYNCDKEYTEDDFKKNDKEFLCPKCGEAVCELIEEECQQSEKIEMTDKDIQTEQLRALLNIEKMLKFFYYITIAGICVYVLSFLFSTK